MIIDYSCADVRCQIVAIIVSNPFGSGGVTMMFAGATCPSLLFLRFSKTSAAVLRYVTLW